MHAHTLTAVRAAAAVGYAEGEAAFTTSDKGAAAAATAAAAAVGASAAAAPPSLCRA